MCPSAIEWIVPNEKKKSHLRRTILMSRYTRKNINARRYIYMFPHVSRWIHNRACSFRVYMLRDYDYCNRLSYYIYFCGILTRENGRVYRSKRRNDDFNNTRFWRTITKDCKQSQVIDNAPWVRLTILRTDDALYT